MRFSVALRCGALCALLILPVGVDAKTKTTPVSGSENDPQTQTSTDQPSFVYLGQTFVVDPGCATEWFVVETTDSILGASAKVIVAVPYPGGVATLPPIEEPAKGALAGKAKGDTVCLAPPAS